MLLLIECQILLVYHSVLALVLQIVLTPATHSLCRPQARMRLSIVYCVEKLDLPPVCECNCTLLPILVKRVVKEAE
jgi:hypothetical protein